jgi:hypothetical protein
MIVVRLNPLHLNPIGVLPTCTLRILFHFKQVAFKDDVDARIANGPIRVCFLSEAKRMVELSWLDFEKSLVGLEIFEG